MTDTDAEVPLCESDDDVDAAREAATTAGDPLVYVKRKGNHALVEVDMSTAGDARLALTTVSAAAELVREAKEAAFDGTDPTRTATTASADDRGVTLGPVPVADAEAVAADLAPLVRDRENWD